VKPTHRYKWVPKALVSDKDVPYQPCGQPVGVKQLLNNHRKA